MEKISGILPSSARIAGTDLRESAPVRPGTPTFGRPQGISSLQKTAPRSESTFQNVAPKSGEIQKDMAAWRSKDMRQAQMAAEISEKFFVKNRTEAGPVEDIEPMPSSAPMYEAAVTSNPSGFKMDEFGFLRGGSPIRPEIAKEAEEPIELQQPEGLFPKGSFIDRTA